MLKPQTKAPSFQLKDQNGRSHSLSDYQGKWLILYFYPKDDTPGCTKEACNFRDYIEQIRQLNGQVVGISADSITSHAEFIDRYQLPFTLLSDPNKKTIKKYQAAQKKKMFKKSYIGVNRITYLINPKGKIAKTYPQVKPSNHAQQIIKDLAQLKKENS